jgi:hypothetical protein
VKIRLAILTGIFSLALCACIYDPVYEGTRCGPHHECPFGYFCVGEGDRAFCVASQPEEDGGGSDDASAGDDGVIGDDGGAGDDGGVGDDGVIGDDGADEGGDDGGDSPACRDLDNDGHEDWSCGGDDCDDGDPLVNPDAEEGIYPHPTCADGRDNDCDGLTDYADPACDREWWDQDFTRRRKIRFDNLEQGALHDFPVLVRLDAGRVDYTCTQDQGQDIRFIDADGVTVLPHEIEKWDDTGVSIVWVKVPEIFGSSNMDFIWMYYGDAGASDLQDPNGVWTEGYEAVYHLNDSFLDSSAPSYNGSNQGSDNKTCLLADCQDFNDSESDYIDLGSDLPILKNVTGCTLSAVVNPESIDSEDYIVSVSVHAGSSTSDSRAALGLVDGNDVIVGGRSADGDSYRYGETTGNLISAGNWYYLVGVIDYQNDKLAIYLDGRFIGDKTAGFSQARTSDTNATRSAIGAQDDGGGDFFDGDIDEVRISRTVRPAEWIAAQHKSITDTFLLFEAEEAY